MDITYRFRKINSSVFQNVFIPVFTLNDCTFIATESRWLHSPSLSAYTHTNYRYKLPLPLNVRASLPILTFKHRDTHIPIVALHVYTGQIGTNIHAHERDVQILCTLHSGQTLWRKCTKFYGGNVPNCTVAMYQTVQRQYTKLYSGNVPNCTAAIGVVGMVASWKNTQENVESPNLPTGGPILLTTLPLPYKPCKILSLGSTCIRPKQS